MSPMAKPDRVFSKGVQLAGLGQTCIADQHRKNADAVADPGKKSKCGCRSGYGFMPLLNYGKPSNST